MKCFHYSGVCLSRLGPSQARTGPVDNLCNPLKLPNRDKNAKILTWKIGEKDLKFKLRRHKNEALQKRTVV